MGGGGHPAQSVGLCLEMSGPLGPTLSWEEGGPSPTICPSFSGTVD